MAKLSVQKLTDVSRYLSMEKVAELTDFFAYMANFTEQIISALRAQLTFEENFRGSTKTVTVRNATDTKIQFTGNVPKHVLLSRVFESGVLVDKFGWRIDGDGRLVVNAVFDPTTTTIGSVTTDVRTITIIILN